MPLYPEPNITTVYKLFEHANSITNGYVLHLAVAGTWVIMLMIMTSFFYKVSVSTAVASFTTLLLSMPLFLLGLIQGQAMIILIVMTIGSIIWAYIDQ